MCGVHIIAIRCVFSVDDITTGQKLEKLNDHDGTKNKTRRGISVELDFDRNMLESVAGSIGIISLHVSRSRRRLDLSRRRN